MRDGRRSGDPHTALRFLAISKLAAGKSTVVVAHEVGLARSTVVAAAQRFAERGRAGLLDGRRGNGRRKAVAAFERRVADALRFSPEDFGWPRPTWTRELLCLQLKRAGFAAVSVATMGRVLARLGARLGVPKPVVLCPWRRDRRLNRLGELRALEARSSRREPVLYVDEVDIHLNPKVGRDWMLPGHQRRVVTPGKNEKFYLAGALDVTSGALITTGAAKKDATLFCALLRLLPRKYADARRIHIILDNYGIHSAKATSATLAELGDRIVLHFLPPYCPDANRIERVWQDLHANVTRNHRCRTMKKLLGKAHDYLAGYVWRASTGIAPIVANAA